MAARRCAVSTLLKYLLLGSIAVILYMLVMRPRQLHTLGGKARLVGLIYVAAVLISAALNLSFGWGQ